MPRTAKTIDPIEQLQKEAAFGRAALALVKEHGMIRTRRYTARKVKRTAKASRNGGAPARKSAEAGERPRKAAKKATKKSKNPLAAVRGAQPE